MTIQHDMTLSVGGSRYRGFTRGEVRLSMDQAAPTFECEYVDSKRTGGALWTIDEGDACVVSIDGEPVVYGHAEDVETGYSATHRSARAAGRGKLGDIVDSSILGRYQFRGKTLADVATILTKPFGIRVRFDGSPGAPFRRFRCQPGDKVFEVLARAARLRGFVPIEVAGELVFTRAGSRRVRTVLRRGENVVSSTRSGTHRNRYSEYHFRGQTQASDELSGKSATELSGEVTDPQIKRHRPLLVTASGSEGNRDLGKAAVLERNRRAGESERVSCVVEGWRDDDGALWEQNTLVPVEDDWVRVHGTLIVVDVAYTFGPNEPYLTRLELTRPEAYDEIGYPTRGRGGVWN